MQSKIFFTVILALATIASGCGEPDTRSNVSNTNTANVNTTNTNTAPANNLETTRKPDAPTANNAPTLAPVVQAYYEALKKKDDALLKSVMSAEFIKSVESDMKEDKKTNIAAYMAEYDTIPDKPVEVRNEKIEGVNAVAELKGGAYVNWTPLAFVNEGGKWKFTGGSPVLK